jgi:molybdopterin-containing oxidoreductase family membrane subunit
MSTAVLLASPSDAELQAQILGTAWPPRRRGWMVAFALSGSLTALLLVAVAYTVGTGIGVWGNMIPVAWGFGIINFVWWIGIGHAGTFISAILYLFEQRWRTSINRFAEAMTLFAVMQAALFPILHLGRPWFAYWLFPYPSTLEVWPQVKSALPWDAAAITTYGTVSLLFWYLGLVPDLAAARDHAPTRARRVVYGLCALGWRGDSRAWRHYRSAYLVLAGLATPLVVSVHSIVSADFAIGLVPGWHSTIFPPFFVAGAIYSGFAMVLTLLVPARAFFAMKNLITQRHLENCAKLMLVTGMLVTYGYLIEFFIAWYSGDPFESQQFFQARPLGPAAWVFWTMLACNALTPQLFWSKKVRQSALTLFFASILINVGMWSERFVIIVMSLQREFLPALWSAFSPTWVDLCILIGTFGCFSLLFLLFLRWVPFVALWEMKELRRELTETPNG